MDRNRAGPDRLDRKGEEALESSTGFSFGIARYAREVRARRPLVHNITNLVVTNIAANALLAAGASPVMAHAPEEVGEMARLASALALNLGTLDRAAVESMRLAGASANRAEIPVILDPVGAGATAYRTQTAHALARDVRISILRGNAGEIGVLTGAGGAVKGVDSAVSGEDLPARMKAFAKSRGCVVIATGETDYVTDGEDVFALTNGTPLLTAVTGSGCMLTALLGAFAAVAGRDAGVKEYARSGIAAITFFNVAAEQAARSAGGPGTFQAALFDSLYRLNPDEAESKARVARL